MRKLVALIIVAVVAVGFVLAVVLYMAPEDSLQKSDAIIAVSGGETTSRANEAIRLYKEGWAPLIIFSGAAKDPNSPSNAEAMSKIAIEQGVPYYAIALDEGSANTHENASRVSQILQSLHSSRIILVTSPYHQRRAYIEFRERLGKGITIINHPALDHAWSKSRWWLTPKGWYLTLTEVPKTLYTQLMQ